MSRIQIHIGIWARPNMTQQWVSHSWRHVVHTVCGVGNCFVCSRIGE